MEQIFPLAACGIVMKTNAIILAIVVGISLGNKFGIALGSAGVAAILAVLGFQANVTQTPLVSGTINNFFTVIPGILSVLCGIVFLFYKIDRKTFNDILSKLNDKVQSNDPDLV